MKACSMASQRRAASLCRVLQASQPRPGKSTQPALHLRDSWISHLQAHSQHHTAAHQRAVREPEYPVFFHSPTASVAWSLIQCREESFHFCANPWPKFSLRYCEATFFIFCSFLVNMFHEPYFFCQNFILILWSS